MPTDTRISDANASWDYNGHTYGLYKTLKTWDQANTFAQSKGGYLVHVDTLAENSNILQQVTANFTATDYSWWASSLRLVRSLGCLSRGFLAMGE